VPVSGQQPGDYLASSYIGAADAALRVTAEHPFLLFRNSKQPTLNDSRRCQRRTRSLRKHCTPSHPLTPFRGHKTFPELSTPYLRISSDFYSPLYRKRLRQRSSTVIYSADDVTMRGLHEQRNLRPERAIFITFGTAGAV
jgi:hypothetical protein